MAKIRNNKKPFRERHPNFPLHIAIFSGVISSIALILSILKLLNL